MNPIIVAAHPLELEGISGGIPIGVGLVEAALGIAAVLEKKPPAVVLVGSCGTYPPAGEQRSNLAIGDVVLGREVVLVAEGELPEIVPVRCLLEPALDMKGRGVVVATTTGITVDDARAMEIAKRTKADVENLEAFAVARACERANVPLTILLGVTNRVGAEGRAEWRANAKRVAASVLSRLELR